MTTRLATGKGTFFDRRAVSLQWKANDSRGIATVSPCAFLEEGISFSNIRFNEKPVHRCSSGMAISMGFRASVACAVCILAAQTHLPPPANAAEAGKNAQKSATTESFKFDANERLLFIPLRIGGKDYQAVVDTGATLSVLDLSLRQHLGPRSGSGKTKTDNMDVDVELYAPPTAQIGLLAFTSGPVVCHDLTSLCEACGKKFHAIIGLDFLTNWIVTVDFDNGRIDFMAPGTSRDAQRGESIPFVYGPPGNMFILVTAGKNIRVPIEIDTGFAGAVHLEESLFSKLVETRDLRITGNEQAMTLSGLCRSRGGRLTQLSVGPFKHEDLRLSTGKQNKLGLDYLRRYRVTIDFPNQRLYLAKGKQFTEADGGNTCGMGILYRSVGIEVEYVDENGPAYPAGVREKDVIIELCGKRVSELKSSEVDDLLTREGKPVRMMVLRGGQRVEMTFTPKEYN